MVLPHGVLERRARFRGGARGVAGQPRRLRPRRPHLHEAGYPACSSQRQRLVQDGSGRRAAPRLDQADGGQRHDPRLRGRRGIADDGGRFLRYGVPIAIVEPQTDPTAKQPHPHGVQPMLARVRDPLVQVALGQ